ncbi:uncharacterized protein LOC118376996 isoform X3 [Oncorhynchus keta]|uniref:uncharacterized protein LOC118376996 isoform X3 n=1 Tax=Oncorhynchus keta TaxID=8018 RepID=UPI00227A4AEA|nr:uncharacterized protein LOC118376996 isoform X3 [Oncorhynchus keta]
MCRSIVSPAPIAQVLQHFFSILSYRFSLLPSLMPLFAAKLRHPLVSSGWLWSTKLSSMQETDCEEIEAVLRSSLPSLCCRVCEWPSLLCESPGPQCDPAGPRATHYCLLTLLHLALRHGDRLLPDSTVFSCVVTAVLGAGAGRLGPASLCAQVCPLPAVCHTGQEPRPGLGSSKLHQQGPVLQPQFRLPLHPPPSTPTLPLPLPRAGRALWAPGPGAVVVPPC